MKALWPDRPVGESLNLGNLADFTIPNPLADLSHTCLGCTLVAHLGTYVMLLGQLGEKTGLIY